MNTERQAKISLCIRMLNKLVTFAKEALDKIKEQDKKTSLCAYKQKDFRL